MRAVSHYETFFLFDGNIQDIRAWQRHKKQRWVPFVFKGQESHAEFPVYMSDWSGHKLSSYQELCQM